MKGFRFTAWLSTALVCFLFWMLLTWSVAPRELLWGGLVSVVVAAFACRFFIHSRAFYLYNPVRLILLVFYCVIIFFWEIIKANVSMAKLVLSPKISYKPGILRIPGSPDLKSDYGIAMVSNCITLTPGTITMETAQDQEGRNYYYVHWIDVAETDRDKAGDAIKGTMERWIGRIWKPTAADRICAMDALDLVTALALVLYSLHTGRTIYLDIALVVALLGFVSTVFVGRYLERRL